jgi:DNA-binding response OmpR family regulator
MLLEDVWNFQPPAYTNVVDVQIGNLRRSSTRPAIGVSSSLSGRSASN